MPIAVLSVKADTLSVEVDLNYTGLVFISVWVFSRGGEGPAVVLSEWEGGVWSFDHHVTVMYITSGLILQM